ncbi:MAG: hypothetical protein R3271_06250 [Methylophaga sp.]|uniref:hypothetical protein n=1 Tax=Methylophaga sp. TaxID=2024840 RepID=UPI00299E785C|nr:hypothetical protein [Methylophaga sp.]MDX1749904.1 hypothetical protein [Methylophaga sp.]
MAKYCVFCGAVPEKKNKEHVVPKWLIKLTGNPKREAYFGFEKNIETEVKTRTFAFDQFSFPACSLCNEKYANLEEQVKPILETIIAGKAIKARNFSVLLDWMDKVRIGLWLGFNQLDKNFAQINPNFHIERRIGQYDRALIVEKSKGICERLNFGGVETLLFQVTPSAFTLTVNNYCFTNISYIFLIFRRLGFPYPRKMYYLPGSSGEAVSDIGKGLERVLLPIIRKQSYEKGKIFYQPMFKGGLISGSDFSKFYDNEYVETRSIDHKNGIGDIFEENDGKLHHFKKEELVSLEPIPHYSEYQLGIKSGINICEWQKWLLTLLPATDQLDNEHKKFIKARSKFGVRFNNFMIEHHKKLLKKAQ